MQDEDEKDETTLLPKYQKFLDSYLRTWNATASYLTVHPNCSRATAAQKGYQWVKKLKPTIQQMSEAMDWTLKDAMVLMKEIAMGGKKKIEEVNITDFGTRERADLLKAYTRLLTNMPVEEEGQVNQGVVVKVFRGNGYDPDKVEEEESK